MGGAVVTQMKAMLDGDDAESAREKAELLGTAGPEVGDGGEKKKKAPAVVRLVPDDRMKRWLGPPAKDLNDDKTVLRNLFKTTGGATWYLKPGWRTSENAKDWYGVRIDRGRVRGLHLADNQLHGRLPRELGSLTKLEELYLGGNGLEGEIPAPLLLLLQSPALSGHWDLSRNSKLMLPKDIGGLSTLTQLHLPNVGLKSTIPTFV